MEKKPWFVVTVDTEADDAWAHPDTITVRNLGQIRRFQNLCNRYGIIPTYLLSYECVSKDAAARHLTPVISEGQCEIGHHLHCWTTPPFQEEGPPGVDTAWLSAFQYELPDSLFFAKADTLKHAIEARYGIQPTAHRAGRWGMDRRTIGWLVESGFFVDTSHVPLNSFRGTKGRRSPGPCFYETPRDPRVIQGELVEIPAGVHLPSSIVARACAGYIESGRVGASVASWLLQRRWLSGGRRLCPNPKYSDGFLERAVSGMVRDDLPVINFSLHSSELLLGTSPFSRTESDAARVWILIERVFRHVALLGLRCAGISTAACAFSGRTGVPTADVDAVLAGKMIAGAGMNNV